MTVTMMEIAIDEIAEDGNVRNELKRRQGSLL